MNEIVTERSGSILRIQLNRPAKKNAMTLSMYATMADILNDAGKDDEIAVVLWHGAGDSVSSSSVDECVPELRQAIDRRGPRRSHRRGNDDAHPL